MQTEAIAALAASGAAVLGVPAALIVGVRQARAAHHAAEVTAHATHDQARKAARREAAVVFVLAAESALDECMRMYESKEPIEIYSADIEKRVLGDTSRAFTVMRIEGPAELAQKAKKVMLALSELTLRGARRQRTAHAWHHLKQSAETSDVISAALGELTEVSGPDDPRVRAAWRAVAGTGVLAPGMEHTLRTHLRVGSHPLLIKSTGMLDAREEVRETLAAFIDAVRRHLDEKTP
ncbi:hypothetical protein [Streptomyces griseorubiginosus]|uniref:hypothetical protein n=1 Tax=Streptomyces griseorubiginosus TaxID=67304 RepID=UPI00365A2AC1